MRPFVLQLAFVILCLFTLFVHSQNDATCSSSRPCKLGCCSTSGNCGFGPAYCGSGNCTSSCDAQAECGQYAPAGSQNCPLSVCCSQYGFCGTTSGFCGTGCQNGCGAVNKPFCGGGSPNKKSIGYYESWSFTRNCDVMGPEDIQAGLWTHLNYAFALIDPGTFRISQMHDYDTQLYPRFTGLKLTNPALKTSIAVGGWTAGGKIFSDMVSTSLNRAAFIDSALRFCKTYGFNGIDIDWEYPVAPDRDGVAADFANFVTFMKELKNAFGNLDVSVTLPSSYWYLKGFDISNLEPHVDWFNLMSYDIHGTWDGDNPYTQRIVQPHTNLTEVNDALNLLWRNNIKPAKVVLGLGFYGRSFTLTDPSCTKPGCPFRGGAKAGECTQESGILSNSEIQRIIKSNNLTPIEDTVAAIKYITWDNNQWVSYDDADTLKMKVDFANSLCLGGTMVWAIDLDSTDSLSAQYLESGGDMTNNKGFGAQKTLATKKQNKLNRLGFWTPCMSAKDRRCPGGYHEIGMVGHGSVYDFESMEQLGGCKGRLNRLFCLRNDLIEQKCQWHRNAKGGKFCDDSCPPGTYFLTQNTQPAGDRKACAHGTYIAICCQDLLSATDTCPASGWDATFSGGLANTGNIDNSFTFGSRTARVKRSENVSEIDGVRKKKRSNNNGSNSGCNPDYYIYPDPPTPPYAAVYAGLVYEDGSNGVTGVWGTNTHVTVTSTRLPASETSTVSYVARTCDGARYPQPCHHYRSVGIRNALYARRPMCPDYQIVHGLGRARYPRSWNAQHDRGWYDQWLTKSYIAPYNGATVNVNCQRDEWPPYDVWRNRDGAYIRFLPGGQNGGVANFFGSRWSSGTICQWPLQSRVEQNVITTVYGVYTDTVWVHDTTTKTRNRLDMTFKNMQRDDQLTQNQCWPQTLTPDAEPGFALFNYDRYYAGTNIPLSYALPPASYVTAGKTPPTKRDIQHALATDGEEVVAFNEGNSSRRLSDEELAEHANIHRCKEDDCREEIDAVEVNMMALKQRHDEIMSAHVADLPGKEFSVSSKESSMVLTDSSASATTPAASESTFVNVGHGTTSMWKPQATAPASQHGHLGEHRMHRHRHHYHQQKARR